jgi:hypothetical protein
VAQLYRDVAGKYAVQHCGEAHIEWNYDIIGGDNSLQNSNQQTKSPTTSHGLSLVSAVCMAVVM